MRFHVMTLFPEMIMQGLSTSITGRAMKNHLIDIEAVNIRDFTTEKHGHVDDYPYGGGAGMVRQSPSIGHGSILRIRSESSLGWCI